MKEQLFRGKAAYISFFALDIACLLGSNYLARWLYLKYNPQGPDTINYILLVAMVSIDVFVTIMFNTLNRVLRRRKRKELMAGFKHVTISFMLLAVLLFAARQGAHYSRIVVALTYVLYFLLFVGIHYIWKKILKGIRYLCRRKKKSTAILMTTDRFVEEGLKELEQQNIEVKVIYLLQNGGVEEIRGVPVAREIDDATAVMCWQWIDKALVYGLDHQMIPQKIQKACWEMEINFNTIDFNYRVIELKTIVNEDPQYGALSFLEGKRDIPFPIRRVYWITETEADLHRGFHAHKLNCQLLFCPYGQIDIILDDGKSKNTVTLQGPDKGLLLMPGMWREMVWKKTGSVLCVLASEYYDPDEYIRDYDEFVRHVNSQKEGGKE